MKKKPIASSNLLSLARKSLCVLCGGGNTSYDDTVFDAGAVSQVASCCDCQKMWLEIYDLKRIEICEDLVVKKPISSSNLALRFYKSAGWTIEELLEIAPKGNPTCRFPDDIDPYFIYENGGQVNVDKLLARCSKLNRAFNDDPTQSDREFMLRHL